MLLNVKNELFEHTKYVYKIYNVHSYMFQQSVAIFTEKTPKTCITPNESVCVYIHIQIRVYVK